MNILKMAYHTLATSKRAAAKRTACKSKSTPDNYRSRPSDKSRDVSRRMTDISRIECYAVETIIPPMQTP